MSRLLLLLAVLGMAACGPTDHTESGAITGVAADAKHAQDAAHDAVAAAEAQARRDQAASQTEPSSGH